jgi:hypothetical protein
VAQGLSSSGLPTLLLIAIPLMLQLLLSAAPLFFLFLLYKSISYNPQSDPVFLQYHSGNYTRVTRKKQAQNKVYRSNNKVLDLLKLIRYNES